MGSKKEMKEFLQSSSSNIDEAFKVTTKKLDLRVIRTFGNLFSDDVVDRVNEIFPNRMDEKMVRHNKIWRLCRSHEPQKDVFFLRHGSKILSALCGITAIYTVGHFRRCLRLQHYARISMYATSIFFPSFLSAVVNDMTIAHAPAVKEATCIPCVAVHSGIKQCIFAIGQVYASTVILGLYHASLYATVTLPPDFFYNRPNTKKAFYLARNIATKNRFSSIFFGLFLLNLAAGYGIGFTEQQELVGLYGTLLLREQHKMDNRRGQAVV